MHREEKPAPDVVCPIAVFSKDALEKVGATVVHATGADAKASNVATLELFLHVNVDVPIRRAAALTRAIVDFRDYGNHHCVGVVERLLNNLG